MADGITWFVSLLNSCIIFTVACYFFNIWFCYQSHLIRPRLLPLQTSFSHCIQLMNFCVLFINITFFVKLYLGRNVKFSSLIPLTYPHSDQPTHVLIITHQTVASSAIHWGPLVCCEITAAVLCRAWLHHSKGSLSVSIYSLFTG